MEQDIRFCKTSDGVRIAYATLGSGPPLVWLVGWLSHLELDFGLPPYRERCERLSENFTLVRLDRRGTGLSQRGIDDFSLGAHVLDIEAVIADVEIGEFGLFGYSEGGPIAIRYAEKHPEKVSHLILGGTFAAPARIAGGPEMQNALMAIIKQQWGLGSGLMAELFFGEDADPAIHRAFAVYQQQAANAEDALHSMEATLEIDVTSSLPSITMPTLVLHGRDDRTSPIENGQELAAGIKGARFVSFEGHHVPNRKQAAQMDKAIREFILGDASEPEPPEKPSSGLVTILFTDMESSTALTQRLGDEAAQELVHEHNRVVREALKANHGSEIKHTGDGIMASFPSTRGALDCAVTIQRGLAESDNPVRVRIGLNAGEPVVEDDDLFGTSVQLAARVCAEADAGEILVSNVVRELSAGKGFLFNDRGDAVLRGFEDPVRLYEVSWRES
ncbi:MAG: adenylate/guanylate cyclase domain-containing protein [Chloroflexi bacterium]|nr:adenylate/guanylate cyclase domain-containing protein [Chloroflexota bacterium]